MTDRRGRCFVSYRRSRAAEVSDLGRRLRVRGIPVWVDISDLGPGSTEEQIRKALEDEGCAAAVAWITPEVADSSVIRRVEVPGIVRRVSRNDGFFGVFVAAGGLDYEGAAKIAAENLGATDLRFWNQHRVDGDPATPEELDFVADVVLAQRLEGIAKSFESGEPLRVGLWVRRQPPATSDSDLQLDWTDSFIGRQANLGSWDADLLPALASVQQEVGRHLGSRRLILHGYPTLAAAVAVGRAFPAVAGMPVTWEQLAEDGSYAEWSLSTPAEPSGFAITSTGMDPNGEGLALLVSVMHDTTLAFAATSDLPAMRAALEVIPNGGNPLRRLTPGAARQLATELADAIRRARETYIGVKDVHLFLAGPVGLAIMVGQLLNAVGPITIYEHLDDSAVGVYRPELRLPPAIA